MRSHLPAAVGRGIDASLRPVKAARTRHLRQRSLSLGATAGAILLASPAQAAAVCQLTQFQVVSYAHSGTYLAGLLDGQYRGYLIICGLNSSAVADCTTPTTDRNVAIALTARGLGQPLSLYFDGAANCAAVTNYAQVTAVTLMP